MERIQYKDTYKYAKKLVSHLLSGAGNHKELNENTEGFQVVVLVQAVCILERLLINQLGNKEYRRIKKGAIKTLKG